MASNQSYKLLHSKGNHEQIEKRNLQTGRKYLQVMLLTRAYSPKYTNSSDNNKKQQTTQSKYGQKN